MKPEYVTPATAKSEAARMKLTRDNIDTLHGWILLNGNTVVISEQMTGKPRTGKVELPLSEFRKMAEWFLKPQRVKVSKRRTSNGS